MTLKFRQCLFIYTLICFIQSIKTIELDKEANEKISDLVGTKQLALRHFLEEMKMETLTFEYKMRAEISEAKNSLKTQVDKIVNDVKLNTESKPEHKTCEDQKIQGTEEILKQAETIHINCVSSSKPNLTSLFTSVTKHAEFQSKIGETPRKCINSNNDVDSIIQCIQNSMTDIGKQMTENEHLLNDKVQEIKLQMQSISSTLEKCQTADLGALTEKSKGIKEKFSQCVKL